MKKIIISFIVVTMNSLFLIGQNLNDIQIFLNSKLIDINKVYLNSNRFDDVVISKTTFDDGRIMLKSKDSVVRFYNLDDVIKKYTHIDNNKEKLLFLINKQIITDTSSVKIDDSLLIYVTEGSLSNVKYLDSLKVKDLTIINIELRSKPKNIRIGGFNNIIVDDK